LSNNLFKISMVSRHFTSDFAYHYFKSPLFFSRIKLKGGAQQHLGHPAIGAHLIPIPPLLEQQEIVRRVEGLFKTADALEARYRTAKAHVDQLTQSILAKAFRGELVPQDPNDEPASVLLKRIRLERNGIAPKKRGHRK
jgi:type I restriction enzyme S subunit